MLAEIFGAEVFLAAADALLLVFVVIAGRLADEALPVDPDFAGPFALVLCDAAEPPVSASATAGIANIAAPKPNVMADAPTQLAILR